MKVIHIMTATITEFYAAASTDASLRAQLQTSSSAQEVVEIAARPGFNFTVAEVASLSRTVGEVELSEPELAGVAGGYQHTTGWGDPNHNETLIVA